MSWAKVDDHANEHRKQLAAGAEACWLWVCGLMYANRQVERDGFIPDAVVAMLYRIRKPERLAQRLVDVGLWDKVEGGYQIHNYLVWNPTPEQVEAARAAGRARAAKSYAARKAKNDDSSGEEKAKSEGSSLPKDRDSSGSTPTPLPSDSKSDPPVSPPAGGPPAPVSAKPRRKPRTQMPDILEPDAANQALARKHHVDLSLEMPKFKAHHEAKGSVFASWQAAIRTWILMAGDFRRNGQGKPPGAVEHDGQRAADQRSQFVKSFANIGKGRA